MTICSSETLTEATWQLAATTLSTRMIDYYGLAKRVSAAFAYAPHEYYFLPGYACNELIPYARDEDSEIYELVATGLWNAKMPLVRFRTGDLVRVGRGMNLDEIATESLDSMESSVGRVTTSSPRTAPDSWALITFLVASRTFSACK